MTTFLLLHGACHSGWCWDAVAEAVRTAGHTAAAPDLPCDDVKAGLAEYAAIASATLGSPNEDVVVVGHSLGALTAAVVAAQRSVRGLVFVAGIVGMPGKSLADLAEIDTERDLPMDDGDLEMDDQGRFRFSARGARRLLYHDCSDDTARSAIDHLRYQRSLWTEVSPFDAWPDVPTMSVVCRDDRVVNPDWSRHVAAERLGASAVELDGGHSPMLSRPVELAEVLLTLG